MLLVPSSILDLHDRNSPARNFCANPLRVGTMQFTSFVFCYYWSASKIVDISAADHILAHTASSPPQTGIRGGGWEDTVSA